MGDFWTYTVKLFAVYNKHGVAVLKPEEKFHLNIANWWSSGPKTNQLIWMLSLFNRERTHIYTNLFEAALLRILPTEI